MGALIGLLSGTIPTLIKTLSTLLTQPGEPRHWDETRRARNGLAWQSETSVQLLSWPITGAHSRGARLHTLRHSERKCVVSFLETRIALSEGVCIERTFYSTPTGTDLHLLPETGRLPAPALVWMRLSLCALKRLGII